MKIAAIVLICSLMVLGLTARASAQVGPPGPPCQGDSDFLAASAAVQQRIPYFIEVEVLLLNKGQAKIQMDPGRFALAPDQGGPMTPLTQEQAVQTVRNPAQTVSGFLLFGIVGLLSNLETQKRWAEEVQARILKGGELPPGSPVKGSVYFKANARMALFTLTLNGLTAESGDSLEAVQLTNCQVPGRRPEVAVSEPPSVKVVALTARAATGPVSLSVSNVEFTKDITFLTVTVDNTGEAEVNLYNAIADATLTDNAGKSYAARMLRTDLAERVAPRGRIHGKLAFHPLPFPPAVTSAVLTVPQIGVGDEVYEIKVHLRF